MDEQILTQDLPWESVETTTSPEDEMDTLAQLRYQEELYESQRDYYHLADYQY